MKRKIILYYYIKKIAACLVLVACCMFSAQAEEYATTDEILTYIDTYQYLAISEMETYGIPASIKLAQAILETGAGKSYLAVSGNNHFGIKCKIDWAGASIIANDDEAGECFRKYENVPMSYQDHSMFLKYNRLHFYDFLFSLNPLDYQAWAKGLRKAGYSTTKDYDKRLIGLINRYNLDRFDYMANTSLLATTSPVPVITKNLPQAFTSPQKSEVSTSFSVQAPPIATYVAQALNKEAKPENSKVIVHILEEGETIESLAKTYKTEPEILYYYNRLMFGAQPAVGEKIYVNYLADKAPKLNQRNYSVKANAGNP